MGKKKGGRAIRLQLDVIRPPGTKKKMYKNVLQMCLNSAMIECFLSCYLSDFEITHINVDEAGK